MTDPKTFEVKCIECGATVTLKPSKGHSEYVPAGKCPKCGLFHYATWNASNGVQVNAARLEEYVR